MSNSTDSEAQRAALAVPQLRLYGHDLRVRHGEFVDVLECVTCGVQNWHSWAPFTGGTWVGESPDFDFFEGEHHRPKIVPDVAVVRDVLAHVGAPCDDIAAFAPQGPATPKPVAPRLDVPNGTQDGLGR